MEKYDKHVGIVLGEIGCLFRSNIEDHIKDYELVKKDDVEWLLEPLTEISHPADLVLDAFQSGFSLGWSYHLYFHNRNATTVYKPYNTPISNDEIEESIFDDKDLPTPSPYDKSMLIKVYLHAFADYTIPEIWVDLKIPFTETGIWQAVLLNETRALFPKGWHDNYNNKIYVFSSDDMEQIIRRHKRDSYNFDHNKLASYLNRDDIWPTVEIDGDKAIATYHYWNDWGGFCRRIIPVEKHGKSVKIGEFEREVLVEYDCGLRY